MTSPRPSESSGGTAPPFARTARLLLAMCALLVAAELVYPKHPHFAAEGWFAFYPLLGAAAAGGLLLLTRVLGLGLQRSEGEDGS